MISDSALLQPEYADMVDMLKVEAGYKAMWRAAIELDLTQLETSLAVNHIMAALIIMAWPADRKKQEEAISHIMTHIRNTVALNNKLTS